MENTRFLFHHLRSEPINSNYKLFVCSITQMKNKYYTIIDDYIIFAESEKNIKSLINNKIAEQTIGKSRALNTINEKLGTKSHTAFYLTFQNDNITWKNIFNSIV